MPTAAIEFSIIDDQLHLIYRPRDDDDWVYRKFKKGEELIIKGTFHLTRRNLLVDNVDDIDFDALYAVGSAEKDFFDVQPVTFLVAMLRGEYFHFNPEILPVGVPVLISKELTPNWKWFSAERKISILRVIAELKPSRIVIGGDSADAIPVCDYERLVDQFPTPHEIRRYVLARVSTVVRQYTDATVDADKLFRDYVNKRTKIGRKDPAVPFLAFEIAKYKLLLTKLKTMLGSEEEYSEYQWQQEILLIIRLLNPKYIAAFTSVPIWDSDSEKTRHMDMVLVDASGNLDVIEIKKPFDLCIITETRYRDNHVPLRELSGTVMQMEKYLRHLNRSGASGEDQLTKRFCKSLPPDFRIKITNPNGILIMGRDKEMTVDQRRDFEVVRRHYKHIADIITYDDLMRRLEAVLNQLKSEDVEL